MAILPEGVGLHVSPDYVEMPTNTFIIDWSTKQISGMDAGLSAMRQAVDIILQNERYRWQAYSPNFGSELEDLVGEEYDFIVSEIPRRIHDAFSVDNRILAEENFTFERRGDKLFCGFDVITVFGAFSEEVEL